MGMYTEIFISTELQDVDDTTFAVLNLLFGDGVEEPESLPDHPFFDCDRWRMVGRCASYYFVPRTVKDLWWDEILNDLYLVSRSDLKAYNGEARLFFDWIMPFVNKPEGEFIGYTRYEEFDEPTLYFKESQNDEG